MSKITQYSRVSHHTLTTTGATAFTVPKSEDFTDGSWSATDLALSEFGVLEGHDELYVRIGDNIHQVVLGSGTTSGGTASPAGSDTFIQFNNSGSFGANSGLTYDNIYNNFFTESKISTHTNTFNNGIGNIPSMGDISGSTLFTYNNSLSGSTMYGLLGLGNFNAIGAEDYALIAGYFDPVVNNQGIFSIVPGEINATTFDSTLGNGSDLTLALDGAEMKYLSHTGKTEGGLIMVSGQTDLSYYDYPLGTYTFLSLKSDGINLKHDTGGFSNTGIFIDDNSQISMNLDNTGITQYFTVSRQSSPSVYDKKFEVDTDGYVTINDLYTLPNVDGSNGQILQTDGSGNVSWANPYIGGLFAQTGDSATVSATTTETSILGSGVGTLTIPADSFQVGDSFHAKIGGVISAANSELLTIRIKSGASTLATLGPIDFTTTTSEFWELEIDFTIRSLGASAGLQTNGQFTYVDSGGSGTYKGSGYNTNTTIDTTSSNTLDITVEWGSTNASNSIMSDIFYLKKVY